MRDDFFNAWMLIECIALAVDPFKAGISEWGIRGQFYQQAYMKFFNASMSKKKLLKPFHEVLGLMVSDA